MSSHPSIRPRMVGKASLQFAIVASQYNMSYVQGLLIHAQTEISELEPDAPVKTHWTPGAFEIPLVVKLLAVQKKYDAIIALGVIIQGETAHATLIGQCVTNSLQALSLEFQVPIIHEVLLVDDEDQARARCIDAALNRGTEAARAAVATARIVRDILSK